MSANCFADTNLLVYAFDSSEPAKQQIALLILEEQGGNGQLTLSTQVLQEFFVTVTRKLAKPLSIEDAYACIQQFGVYPMVHITPELILRAISRTRDDAFSFWDSLIVEAALQAGMPFKVKNQTIGFSTRDAYPDAEIYPITGTLCRTHPTARPRP